MPARPLSNGLSAWVKPCARQVFLRHVSAVDENTATARQLLPSPQTHATSCQETVVTPDVASIMELPKGSLASLEKRLLGKKDPRSVVPNSFRRDLDSDDSCELHFVPERHRQYRGHAEVQISTIRGVHRLTARLSRPRRRSLERRRSPAWPSGLPVPLALPLLGMTFGAPLRLLALLFGML